MKPRTNKPDAVSTPNFRRLCKLFNYRCVSCGKYKPLTADHIIPTSRGGLNRLWNIQPLCRSCNTRKGVKAVDYRLRWKWRGVLFPTEPLLTL